MSRFIPDCPARGPGIYFRMAGSDARGSLLSDPVAMAASAARARVHAGLGDMPGGEQIEYPPCPVCTDVDVCQGGDDPDHVCDQYCWAPRWPETPHPGRYGSRTSTLSPEGLAAWVASLGEVSAEDRADLTRYVEWVGVCAAIREAQFAYQAAVRAAYETVIKTVTDAYVASVRPEN